MSDASRTYSGNVESQGGPVLNGDNHAGNDFNINNIIILVGSCKTITQDQCENCKASAELIRQLPSKLTSIFANFQPYKPHTQDDDTNVRTNLGACDSPEHCQPALLDVQQTKESFVETERDHAFTSPDRNAAPDNEKDLGYVTVGTAVHSPGATSFAYGLVASQQASTDLESRRDCSVVLKKAIELILASEELIYDLLCAQTSLDFSTFDLPIFGAGNTAPEKLLLLAAAYGNEWAAHLAFKAGANVNARDSGGGETALNWASRNNHAPLINLLIERQADVNAKNVYGATPLIWASFACSVEVAVILLRHGAEVNEPDIDGFTPLHWAAIRGSEPMVRFLLANGADASIEDKSSKTPRKRAIAKMLKMCKVAEKPAGECAEYQETMGRLTAVARLLRISNL